MQSKWKPKMSLMLYTYINILGVYIYTYMVGCVCAKECEHTRVNSYLALLKVREAIADDFITQRVVKSSAYIFSLLYICINELYTM